MAEHEDIEAFIPWYVNGTLNEAEMDSLNAHLDGCSSCADLVQAEIRFAQAARQAPAELGTLPALAQGRDALLARLPGRRPVAPAARRHAAWLVPVAVLAIASASFLAGRNADLGPFQTMTLPAGGRAPTVQVLFTPGADPARVDAVLGGMDAVRVEGPSATGIYRVVLPRDGDGEALARRLSGVPEVRWAVREGP